MQKRGYLAGIGDPEFDKREHPEFRSQGIPASGHNGLPVRKQGVELVHKIRIKVQESPVKHLVEFVDIIVDRGKCLYLGDKLLRVAHADVFQDVVLVLPCSVYVLRKDAEKQGYVFLLDLVGFQTCPPRLPHSARGHTGRHTPDPRLSGHRLPL